MGQRRVQHGLATLKRYTDELGPKDKTRKSKVMKIRCGSLFFF